MVTPTTPHVMARDDGAHPMFRPGNQANLVPAEPTNWSATQAIDVAGARRGNPMGTGLVPQDEATFASQMRFIQQKRDQRKQAMTGHVAQLQKELRSVEVRINKARATGRDPAAADRRKARLLRNRLQALANIQQAEAKQAAKKSTMPFHRGARIKQRFSPPTPDPLIYEPVGISHQKNLAKIKDMQDNIQPVRSWASVARQDGIRGLGELATQPLVLGALTIGALYYIHKMRSA